MRYCLNNNFILNFIYLKRFLVVCIWNLLKYFLNLKKKLKFEKKCLKLKCFWEIILLIVFFFDDMKFFF